MLRQIFTVVAVLGTVAAPASAGPAGNGDAGARPPAFVRLVECTRGSEPSDRRASFRGTMDRLPGTERMSMRFTLQERVGDGGFRNVKAPGLGAWRKSRPGVRRFAHRQRVVALAEGSAYRMVVSFRWRDREGHTIRRARRRSQSCGQPGVLPNLSLVHVTGGRLLPAQPPVATYTVRVANRGHAAAPRFGVSLAVDGAIVDTQSVLGLSPGERRDLIFTGPLCQGTVTARVDPDDAVREASERDNILASPCPLRP